MSDQLSFDLKHPVSHRHDPVTSKEAEASITQSGVRKTNNERVAWLVARYPNKTASELAQLCTEHFDDALGDTPDKRLFEIRRRLSDMNDIHVQQGDARKALLSKREVTWRVK
jgi:hypothetical protein